MKDDVTLLITGPLSLYTLFMLQLYSKTNRIILVMPKIDNKVKNVWEEIQGIAADKDHKISFVIYDDLLSDNVDNKQNRYLHFSSVVLGLNLCSTKYVIKIRSDEFYSDLTPMVDAIKKYKNRITTNDVFFRKTNNYPFHPSDHLIGGSVKLMKSVFVLAKSFCENENLVKSNMYMKHIEKNKCCVAEQYLGCAVMATLYPDAEVDSIGDSVEFMKKSFYIIDSSKLGAFRINVNSMNKDFSDTSYFDPNVDCNNIELYS